MTALCRTCRIRDASVRGECLTCYHYRRRTRKRRPRSLDTPDRLYQAWTRGEGKAAGPARSGMSEWVWKSTGYEAVAAANWGGASTPPPPPGIEVEGSAGKG